MKHVQTFESFLKEDVAIQPIDSKAEIEYSAPGVYSIKGYVEDSNAGPDTVAKRFTLQFELGQGGGIFEGYKWEDSFVLAMSVNSLGVYTIGNDIEKFMGIPEADVKRDIDAGKETPNDAIIYGMCNVMNGGKDVYFWTNGTRLGGTAKTFGVWPSVLEQVSHEAGVHLNRLLLTRAIAKKLGVSTENEDWVTYDYGAGEYSWPAVGDPNDKTPKIIAIDEETFATMGGAVVVAVTNEFFKMATKYVPELSVINTI